MVKESSVDDDFQNVVESTAHVYINSFLNMEKPVRQTRIESKELDRQWQSITQGREEIGLEGDNTYLDAALTKEQGLSSGTAARLDLATFSHVVFVPTMDVERVQRALGDFAKLFLKKDFKTKANQKPLQEAYSQLVAILLALYTRHNRTTPRRISIDDIRNACNSDIIHGPMSLPELSKGPALQLARRVANDVKQLESLYNNTLKKIIERVRVKERSLPRPSDNDAVFELQKEHDKRVANIYKKEPKDKSVDVYRDVVWLDQDESQDTATSSQQKQQQQEEQKDVEMEEPIKKQSSKAPTTRRTRQQRPSSPQQEDIEIDVDDVLQPPAKLLLSHNSAKAGASTSGSSAKQLSVRETRRSSAVEATKKISQLEESRKRHKNGPDNEESQSEEHEDDYEEEEEEEEEEPAKKRKKSKKDSKSKQKRREGSSSSSSAASASEESDDESMSDPEPARSATGRRMTRRWTEKEVAQLLKLVPKFQYSDSEIAIKKRTVKWAALKAYDQKHGHVLRHRNQVMLKDKYREQTDRGQHRQRVHELSKARAAEKEKAAKEAALAVAAQEAAATAQEVATAALENATNETVRGNAKKANS
ncbi:hypothetical protein BGZ95_001497 [Linnemannia exigua]|uniref:Uncharacterized protein n=1 Tax=Linnemannia exigua TaxID=604196 RepID=A0AAD4H3Q3_9FUNG|nr:hypothetical protein BGZ95_001497 [Linnemannia exigua]